MNLELTKRIDQACTTAEEFIHLFYNRMDKCRHQIGKLYLDSGELVWNGNGVSGCGRIQQFLLELPNTAHSVTSLDAQPVINVTKGTPPSVLVQVAGKVTINSTSEPRPFYQTFLITAHDDKWKIVSDCFRITVENVQN